ncbi:hypothetical protein MMSP_0092 [Mycobacterium sp. 012931]|nr:hypothetical protein MMSP_0092 [Mycobacterium sp. 012931]
MDSPDFKRPLSRGQFLVTDPTRRMPAGSDQIGMTGNRAVQSWRRESAPPTEPAAPIGGAELGMNR